MILLAIGIAALVISLLHCFFGYRLARFLLPVCGVLLIEGALYIFVYKSLMLDTMGTWLFFAGTGLSSYFVLFFFQRIAAFFTGLTGAALFLVFVVYAFSLHTLPVPPDKPHTYVITVYALDASPALAEGFSQDDLLFEIKGHVLAAAQISATYAN